MKKVLMLVAIMLGTSVMVNAKTTPAKAGSVKEMSVLKHAKHEKRVAARKAKTTKKIEVAKISTPKVKK